MILIDALYKFYIAYYVFIFVKMRIACDERMRFPSYFEFWALLYASQKNPIRWSLLKWSAAFERGRCVIRTVLEVAPILGIGLNWQDKLHRA
jgi:hypothetical protein